MFPLVASRNLTNVTRVYSVVGGDLPRHLALGHTFTDADNVRLREFGDMHVLSASGVCPPPNENVSRVVGVVPNVQVVWIDARTVIASMEDQHPWRDGAAEVGIRDPMPLARFAVNVDRWVTPPIRLDNGRFPTPSLRYSLVLQESMNCLCKCLHSLRHVKSFPKRKRNAPDMVHFN
jgi:hypothetical protein